MSKIKDKDQEILESELTIVGFVFFTVWLLINLFIKDVHMSKLNSDLYTAKTIVVELSEKEDTYLEMIASLNAAMDDLILDLQDYKYLEKLKKDLDRSTSE